MSLFYATLGLFQGNMKNLAQYLPTVTSKSLSADFYRAFHNVLREYTNLL